MIEPTNSQIDASLNITVSSVAALIVTYNPDLKFIDCAIAISKQVSHVIIIDNHSSVNSKIFFERVQEIHNVDIIFNNQNAGLASALNQGIAQLRNLDYHWAITLDQDSTATPGMVCELISTLNKFNQVEEIAFIGSYIKDEGNLNREPKWLSFNKHLPFLFKSVKAKGIDLDNITTVITSGALTNLDMFQEIGMFRDDFFIDYIDTEYCLRARKNGYKIIVSANAVMYHNLGNQKEVSFLNYSITPNFHKPFRRYYIARNQIAVLQEYFFLCPHWALFDIMATFYNLFRIVFFENQKKQNIYMIAKGYMDGVRGKFGRLKI